MVDVAYWRGKEMYHHSGVVGHGTEWRRVEGYLRKINQNVAKALAGIIWAAISRGHRCSMIGE